MRLSTIALCSLLAASFFACSEEGADCEPGKVELEQGVCVSEGVAPGYSGEVCGEDSALDGTPGYPCEIAWVCGSHTLALVCEPAGSGYLCHCNENAISVFDFFSPNACEDVTRAYRGDIAVENCNWPVAWTW